MLAGETSRRRRDGIDRAMHVPSCTAPKKGQHGALMSAGSRCRATGEIPFWSRDGLGQVGCAGHARRTRSLISRGTTRAGAWPGQKSQARTHGNRAGRTRDVRQVPAVGRSLTLPIRRPPAGRSCPMIPSDLVLVIALAVFSAAWWWRSLPGRSRVLVGSAVIALLAGVVGLVLGRWQAAPGVAVGVVLLVALVVRRRATMAPRSAALRLLSGSVVTLMAAGVFVSLWWFPVSALPVPPGPHGVGVRTFELVDRSRLGVLAAAADEPRRLLVRVWYPAGDLEGREPLRYFSDIEARTTARGLGEMVGFPPFLTYLTHVRTHSYESAPLLTGEAPWPVVFYSHGFTSFLGQNTALMEALASHGYVVYSIQHPHDAAPTPFRDGTVIPTDPAMAVEAARPQSTAVRHAKEGRTLDERLDGLIEGRLEDAASDDRMAFRSAPAWIADRLFVHDQLQRGAVPADVVAIAAAGAFDRVGEMGMSFGGAVAGAVCIVDRRCGAGVNLDGWDTPMLALDADMPVPFMMFHSDLAAHEDEMGMPKRRPARSYNELAYERFATAGMRQDVVRVQLLGTRHLGLSDLPWFIRRPLRDPLFGNAPAEAMLGAPIDFVLGFFDHHLRGQANGFPQPQLNAWRDGVVQVDGRYVRDWWRAKPMAEREQLERRIASAKLATPVAKAMPRVR
ncbi:alpha/beta hydrolase [Luteimonas sp. RIT-PG2_3]